MSKCPSHDWDAYCASQETPQAALLELLCDKFPWVEELTDGHRDSWPTETIQHEMEKMLHWLTDKATALGVETGEDAAGERIKALETEVAALQQRLKDAGCKTELAPIHLCPICLSRLTESNKGFNPCRNCQYKVTGGWTILDTSGTLLTCPECYGDMREPRVAVSRKDNKTKICPDCGISEGILAALGARQNKKEAE